tara:strand:- start:20453 stop:21175 length:723 start_codon:yes stop_codon:yes gene_type:complete
MKKMKPAKTKIAPTKPRPKNRYVRNAKLSEYRFLKILRGFAEDRKAQELAKEVGISEKTIRTTYRQLRRKLIEAVEARPQAFGKAGFYLKQHQDDGWEIYEFIFSFVKSEIFDDYVKRHAPRLKPTDNVGTLWFEAVIRTFCSIAIGEKAVLEYSPEFKESRRKILEFIAEAEPDRDHEPEGVKERFGDRAERMRTAVEGMDEVLKSQRLAAIRFQSRSHHYPRSVLYDDLRRYLLRSPL